MQATSGAKEALALHSSVHTPHVHSISNPPRARPITHTHPRLPLYTCPRVHANTSCHHALACFTPALQGRAWQRGLQTALAAQRDRRAAVGWRAKLPDGRLSARHRAVRVGEAIVRVSPRGPGSSQSTEEALQRRADARSLGWSSAAGDFSLGHGRAVACLYHTQCSAVSRHSAMSAVGVWALCVRL